MKIFKQKKRYELDFDFISLSVSIIAFITLSFFALNIPKKEKGILFAFQENAQIPSNYIRFSINDKGQAFVEDEPVEYEDVIERLKPYLLEDSTRAIYLIIHQNAPYDYFIKAFDITNQAFSALKLSPKIFIAIIKR